MIIIRKYNIYSKDNVYYIISEETHTCPSCHGSLKVWDSRLRKVILSDSESRIFRFRRFKCTQCGTLHTELPDIIEPYRHYSRPVIETAIHGSLTSCPAENSTIYRWIKAFK